MQQHSNIYLCSFAHPLNWIIRQSGFCNVLIRWNWWDGMESDWMESTAFMALRIASWQANISSPIIAASIQTASFIWQKAPTLHMCDFLNSCKMQLGLTPTTMQNEFVHASNTSSVPCSSATWSVSVYITNFSTQSKCHSWKVAFLESAI